MLIPYYKSFDIYINNNPSVSSLVQAAANMYVHTVKKKITEKAE